MGIIDDYTFGDLKSFKAQFSNLQTEEEFAALRERIKPICHIAEASAGIYQIHGIEFRSHKNSFPQNAEQRLYDLVSGYLQREKLYALPSSQRQLMTLICRKLLASSTYTISGTLDALANRLETAAKRMRQPSKPEEVTADFEAIDEVEEEWTEDEPPENAGPVYTVEDKGADAC